MKKTYKSDAFESIHLSATALFKVGAIDKVSMRNYDKGCLAVVDSLQPESIKEIRNKYKLSQAVFAVYLNTSKSTIEKWEAGLKKPSGAALKLLAIVQKYGIKVLNLEAEPFAN
ncbi:MAG: DNA-binding transcriptional regulator [Pseudomonadota bacterium]